MHAEKQKHRGPRPEMRRSKIEDPRCAGTLPSLLAAALLLALAAPAQAGGTFTVLGDFAIPASMWYSQALGVSADGSTAVGAAGLGDTPGTDAFRWTASGGMQDLGNLGGSNSAATGVSSDGSVVAGWSYVAGNAYYRAFVWTSGSGMLDLGTLGGTGSSASSISSDGTTVAGWANISSGAYHAFTWTSGGGMQDLGTLGGTNSDARGLSANGSVVVGVSDTGGGSSHAFRWTSAGGMADLGTLGGTTSQASSTSADGSVVVGFANVSSGNNHAFIWTGAGGMADLGLLAGGTYSLANGVSGDGKVVVGYGDDSGGLDNAFRWTQSTGMQTVEQWLAAAGVTLPVGLALTTATATNSDGSVVVGYGNNLHGNTEAWLARVSALGSGFMNVSDYTPTLARNGDVPRMGIDLASLTLFGVHHRPLMDSGLPAGKCGWATADAGHSDIYDTDRQLTEVGACSDLADDRWRVGAGLGASWSRQGFSYGGEGKYNGNYLYAEADYAPESRRWIASVSAMYSNWNTTISRGYLNGGSNDRSTGSPDATGWSLRARMDWKDLARLGAFAVSPFAAVTHTVSHLDAYTETGGGFPARFNAQDWSSDEVRVGTVLQKALSPATDLRLNLEAANRLDGSGPGVSGQVLGLFSFSYAGADVKSTWLRAMAEVDHRLSDKSLISANINAASSGEDPSWGASIGYKRAF